MSNVKKTDFGKVVRNSLKADCQNCFGLCCTALNIAVSSDFAMNKSAGTPCPNLHANFSCQIHSELRNKGFKGCTVYDCLGAGQWVCQTTFNGQDWRSNPEIADTMFSVFPIMEQLYEMIAFVAEAMSYDVPESLYERLQGQLEVLQSLTNLKAKKLLAIDITQIRLPVNTLLLETSERIRKEFLLNTWGGKMAPSKSFRGANWIGKNAKGKDLSATDFRGAYLIAANLENADLRGVDLIGADLRDVNIRGANLSTAMFVTQMQMNATIGNHLTQLPYYLTMPSHWHDALTKKEANQKNHSL